MKRKSSTSTSFSSSSTNTFSAPSSSFSPMMDGIYQKRLLTKQIPGCSSLMATNSPKKDPSFTPTKFADRVIPVRARRDLSASFEMVKNNRAQQVSRGKGALDDRNSKTPSTTPTGTGSGSSLFSRATTPNATTSNNNNNPSTTTNNNNSSGSGGASPSAAFASFLFHHQHHHHSGPSLAATAARGATTTPTSSTGGGSSSTATTPQKPTDVREESPKLLYNCLLRNEVLGEDIENIRDAPCENNFLVRGSGGSGSGASGSKGGGSGGAGNFRRPSRARKSLFTFKTPGTAGLPEVSELHHMSLSALSSNSQKLLVSPRKLRNIPKTAYKVLDAPDLQDDFYLNLVDWSSENTLGVGLGASVYLWNACTSAVTKLCDFSSESDTVTSVRWNSSGRILAVGSSKGGLRMYDVIANKCLIDVMPHSGSRLGSSDWNGDLIATGSRDRKIHLFDIRRPCGKPRHRRGDPAPPDSSDGGGEESTRSHGGPIATLNAHRQEVCGLRWSTDGALLASGGNDNKLYIWNSQDTSNPLLLFSEHQAAIKALAWSPHQCGLLASGGGTADKAIRFWNTQTGQAISSVNTNSQVCNIQWSPHSNELVSTHGYQDNKIILWRYPSMAQTAKLGGHSMRVLYLAMSPDGESIVTGAGDETLRFWNVFAKSKSVPEPPSSKLDIGTVMR